ncbi:MAG: Tll0287-like domain-containing protein [Gammaproteobacteria bacterium]
MNKYASSLLVVLFLSSMPLWAAQTDDRSLLQQYLEKSRQIAKAFSQSLGATLKSQLENSGTESAISVCKHVAPALAEDYSDEDRIVSRVSLKNRNSSLGKPDEWERRALERFEQEKAALEAEGSLESSAVTEEADGRWFRYLKAIPTQAMCLQCHGKASDIAPKVKSLLAKEYPEDRAVGYSAGDIRGAVSIKWKLQD